MPQQYEELLLHKREADLRPLRIHVRQSTSVKILKAAITWSLFEQLRAPAESLPHVKRTYSLIRIRFEGDSSGRMRWEHTQPPAFSSVRKSHSHSSSFLFISVFISFFFSPYSSFLQCSKECSLYRVAGVHWSDSTPMSHTHPMCLLLATLTKRGREWAMKRKKGSKKERGGGISRIWYALCMSDLYKTKTGEILWM